MTLTIEQQLAEFGLKPNEIKVYLTILELGEVKVGQIEKQTELHKQLIYNAALSLQEKGLISISEVNGRKHFSITSPTALEEQAKAQATKAQQLVPKLFEMANKRRPVDEIRTFRGNKGVQQYYLQMMRAQPEETAISILAVGSKRYFEIFKPDELPHQHYEEMRLSKKVTQRVLLFSKDEEEGLFNKGRHYFELRVLPDTVQGPIDIVIWYDRVALLFYAEEPYVLDIVGQETARGFKEYFQVLWKQGKEVRV